MFHIPPSEIGARLSSKDVGQILAFEALQSEVEALEVRKQAQANEAAEVRRGFSSG